MGKYSKFIVAVIGAILTVVVQQYGSSPWVQAIIPIVSALGVYQVKNQ